MKKKAALTPAALDALKDGTLLDLLTPGLLVEARASGGGISFGGLRRIRCHVLGFPGLGDFCFCDRYFWC